MNHTLEAVETTTLGNGLRVVSETIPGSRTCALGVWVAVGSRDEAPELSGASHFLEHLLFKGTASRSARDVADAIDAVGGDMNAYTAREHTAFFARVPEQAAELASGILFDVIARPALRPGDVDTERRVIAEELSAAVTTPDDLVFMALYEELFGDHPLGRDILGDGRTIGSMTSDDIRSFHDRWYRPANLVVACAGAVEHGRLVDLASRSLASRAAGETPVRTQPAETRPAVVGRPLPVEQLHAAIGWRAFGHEHPDRYALAIANQILGGSPSSRLFQSIRETRALAYTVYSSTSGYSGTGSATVYAATAVDRGPELLEALRSEVAELVDAGVSSREVEQARSGFEGALVLSLEDSGSRMSRIANGMTFRDGVVSIDVFLERLAAVTVDDVNDVIGAVYGGPPVVSLVGPAAALAACGCG